MAGPTRRITITAVGLAVFTALGLSSAAQTSGQPERFTALAVNMNRGGSATIEIVVNRWSTDAERDRLLNVLQDMPRVGYFRNIQSIGYDVHYARRTPLPEGGERVVLATDRRIAFW